jgi:hypothetical protein
MDLAGGLTSSKAKDTIQVEIHSSSPSTIIPKSIQIHDIIAQVTEALPCAQLYVPKITSIV